MPLSFRPLGIGLCAVLSATCVAESYWSQWRGPTQQGVAPEGTYAVQWSPQENVAWQVEIPGRGGSTPIVWENQAFVTSGLEGKNRLWAVELQSGKTNWSLELGDDRGGKHRKGSGSNPSAVTDGKAIYAYFRSGDLAAVDLSGKLLWRVNLQSLYGEDTLWWDLGTSPILTETAVVVAVMQSGPSYLVALDKASGKVQWKESRMLDAPEEAAQSYSTPLLTTVDGQPRILVLGADHVTCHDARRGAELWRVGGFNPGAEKFFRSIASPVISDDLVICPYARGNTLTAIRLSDHQIAWMRDDLGADVPTPAAQDGKIYLCTDKGKFACLQAATGKTLWEGEFPKNRAAYSCSPILADEHIYLTREDGVTFVIKKGDAFEIVSENKLPDASNPVVATPTPVPGGFLFRVDEQLIRVGK